MLDPHAEAAEGAVIGFLVFGQFPVLGLLERNIEVGVVLLQPLIAAVGLGTRAFGQRRAASPDLQIMHPARRRV